jgi:serine phosphatase RsbU (regulator of sigma subunit)
MMIGDVTGKGVGAATVTSLVRHTARAASEFDSRPAQILARVDAALRRGPSISLCTALCLRISVDGAVLAVGGHPLPMRLSGADGEVAEVGTHGTLLGALERTRWPEQPIALQPGDTLLAFTDGVTDAVGEHGQRWGTDRLKQTLASMPDSSPVTVRRGLVQALDEFQVGAQADDTAVVAMRYLGPAAAGSADAELSSVDSGRNG